MGQQFAWADSISYFKKSCQLGFFKASRNVKSSRGSEEEVLAVCENNDVLMCVFCKNLSV